MNLLLFFILLAFPSINCPSYKNSSNFDQTKTKKTQPQINWLTIVKAHPTCEFRVPYGFSNNINGDLYDLYKQPSTNKDVLIAKTLDTIYSQGYPINMYEKIRKLSNLEESLIGNKIHPIAYIKKDQNRPPFCEGLYNAQLEFENKRKETLQDQINQRLSAFNNSTQSQRKQNFAAWNQSRKNLEQKLIHDMNKKLNSHISINDQFKTYKPIDQIFNAHDGTLKKPPHLNLIDACIKHLKAQPKNQKIEDFNPYKPESIEIKNHKPFSSQPQEKYLPIIISLEKNNIWASE